MDFQDIILIEGHCNERPRPVNHHLLTSAANERRFFSPPDIPVILPGIPIIVSAHLVNPSCNKQSWLMQKLG